MKLSTSISNALVVAVFVQLTDNITAIDDLGTCESEATAQFQCIFDNFESCGEACSNVEDSMEISDTFPTCGELSNALCGQLNCCPACSDQALAFGQCLVTAAGVGCNLECSGALPPAGILWGSVAALIGAAHFMLG